MLCQEYLSGIFLNRERSKIICCAGDMVIFADSLEDIKPGMNKIRDCRQLYDLNIDTTKTKLIIVNKEIK